MSKELDKSRLYQRVIIGVKVLLVVGIIKGGVEGAKYLLETAPKAKKRKATESVVAVYTSSLKAVEHQVVVEAMGTVSAADELDLRAQVSGKIVTLNSDFTKGAVLDAGTELVTIDGQDYELELIRRRNELVKAEADLSMEMGRQSVARRELELLGKDMNDSGYDLALRKPQLKQVKAALALAENNVKKAELDLSRTKIEMPFKGIIAEKHVALGSQATAQQSIARVVGAERYWITTLIPEENLKWLEIDGEEVRVEYGEGAECRGRVVRLLSTVDRKGRMARLLAEVKNPLALETPLFLDAYVKVQIQGKRLDNVIRISREYVHDNNTVWLYGADQRLKIVTVEPVWNDKKSLYVKAAELDGKKIVISDISVPVDELKLLDRSNQE